MYRNMLVLSADFNFTVDFNFIGRGLETFLRFAAVFVSFWQNPQTDSHFAIRRTPVVFQGGWTWPLLHVVLPNVGSKDIIRDFGAREEGWQRAVQVIKSLGTSERTRCEFEAEREFVRENV